MLMLPTLSILGWWSFCLLSGEISYLAVPLGNMQNAFKVN